MGYSIDPISDNCYPDTTVLINKLDIRDEVTLNKAENLATYINASKLEEQPLECAFDFAHYMSTSCCTGATPHFYNAFYVYQSATGFWSAVAIANKILKTGDASNYLKFLATGGSIYPLDKLKIAIDLTKLDTVANALRIFEETLEEFEM